MRNENQPTINYLSQWLVYNNNNNIHSFPKNTKINFLNISNFLFLLLVLEYIVISTFNIHPFFPIEELRV